MNELAVHPNPPALEEIELDANLVIAGHMATWWSHAGSSYGCLTRFWGHELKRGSLTYGNDMWVVSHYQFKRVPGLLVTKHVNIWNGGTLQESYWFPLAELVHVKIVAKGRRLTSEELQNG